MHILVVEDEVKVASFLRQALEEEGYTVDVAFDGEAGLAHAQGGEYDLLVLDQLLPHLSGLALCRQLRQTRIETPILMVTARDAVEEKVAGLDAGVDDYLTKPFSLVELLARVRALLRRGRQTQTSVLRVEDLALDPHTRQATRGDRTVELSAREYALLDYLMHNAHRPITRAMIAEHVWGFHFDIGSNVIDVYVNYLRNKIDSDPEHRLIRTLRHIGYQLG
jgi:DNA-binding response OmpR family regulator